MVERLDVFIAENRLNNTDDWLYGTDLVQHFFDSELCVALDDIMDEETQLLFDTLLPVAEARLNAEALARGSHQKQ